MPYGDKLLTPTPQSANKCSKSTIKALEKHHYTIADFVLNFEKTFAHLVCGSIIDPEVFMLDGRQVQKKHFQNHVVEIQEKHLTLAWNVLQGAKMKHV